MEPTNPIRSCRCPNPARIARPPLLKGLSKGQKCTFTYSVTPCPDPLMFGSCADKMESLDSGETTVRFSVAIDAGRIVKKIVLVAALSQKSLLYAR